MNNTLQSHPRFAIHDLKQFKQKLLGWAQRFDHFCFLDNHQYPVKPHSVECVLAAGIRAQIRVNSGQALHHLQLFINSHKDKWLFGHLGYDLKNEIEALSSLRPAGIQFPDVFFFEPEILVRINGNDIIIEGDDPEIIFAEIMNAGVSRGSICEGNINIQQRISKERYVSIVNQLRQHILRGDCYEVNFCQEFFANGANLNPLEVYRSLSRISPNPFSALYKVKDQWLICTSPERFLKKQGKRILSQPIKGTSKRIKGDPQMDKKSRDDLFTNKKERAENVMIVDLVRNDLSKICVEGSVKVDELQGIYSFPQVHQMISTISGTLRDNASFTDIIRATFPMGSMTGAPKRRVMELIEEHEDARRGIFSGALGYIAAGGDFDLNVVIRSIMYNQATHYVSCYAGSAITFYSDPEKEWEECLLKSEAMRKILAPAGNLMADRTY